MKKSTLIKLAALLGLFAGSAAHSQTNVFNMQDISQGYHNNGYNYMYYGQGAANDTGNNIWNGFDDGNGPGSTASFGGGNDYTDPLTATPGNPYAHTTGGYWAPDSGAAAAPVLFNPSSATVGNTSAGNTWSDGTLSPITVPQLVRGFDSGNALNVSARTNAEWIFSIAAVVNTGSPGWGPSIPPFAPLGLCVLSNVPPGTYSLYLYGANFDGTRGASFVVSNTGTPLTGIFETMNPNAAAGSGPLTNFDLGVDYVVYNNVTPDANGAITITWGAVSNALSGLTGEGDFNGLQLVPSAANPTVAALIVQQPFNSFFGEAGDATLFADGRGNPAPAFQWYGPSGLVAGQTSSTLSFANFQTSEAGNYYCVVSNTGGAVTSAVAQLGIIVTAPVVVAQTPTTGPTVAEGAVLTQTISVSAIGAVPMTYYWESNDVVIDVASGSPFAETSGTNIDFGTSSSITVSNITSSCTLICIVSNALGTVTNTPIVVTIAPTPTYSYATAILALNPVGYWPLNETNGTTAVNFGSFGPAANGVYSAVAACPLLQGVPGPNVLGMGSNNFGTQFSTQNSQDGTDTQTGVVINDTALDTASDNNITIAMWVQQPAGTSYGIQEVYGQADSTLIRFTVFGNNNAQMDFVDGGNDIIGGPQLNDGQWHFWTGTFTASDNGVVTYLDGQQIATGTESAPGHSTDPTVIGGSPDDTGRNFIGSVCQVAVIPQVLTAAQVAALFSAAGVAPTFTINPPPNVIASAGDTADLGPVDAVGSEPLSYSWFAGTPGSGTLLSDGGRISGATSTNLVISPVSASDQNSYYVVASNTFATVTSSVVTLSVSTSNTARVFAGQNPTFAVASGFDYQWSIDGVNVSGATNATFILTNAQTGSNVVCAITTSSGNVTSVEETLNVVPMPADTYAQTVLNDHPIAYYRLDEANVYGDNGNGDDGLPAYDYISGDNGIYTNVVLNTNVTGAPYGVQLTDADGDATFGTFANPDSFAGYISGIDFSVAPSNSPAQPGNATFSVECWIQGENAQHNGAFVTKGYGFGSQSPSPGFFEQFSLQNSDLGSTGSRIEFDVRDAMGNVSTSGTGAGVLDGNWHHVVGVCDQANGEVLLYVDGLLVIPNFGTGTITPGSGVMSTPVPMSIGSKQSEENTGVYDGQWVGDIDEVSIYNYALSSNQVAAHYVAVGIAPVIVTAPQATITADAGTTTNFTVVALGTLPLGYQWSGPGGVIAGATNATLTLVDVNFSGTPPNTGQGTYTVTITNLYGTNSASGVLNVAGGSPTIVQDLQPDTYTIAGGTAVFPVVVEGSVPITSSWQLNGSPLVNGGRISGATSDTLTISNVQASDAGNYQLIVANSSGTNNSSVSTLVVDAEPMFNTNGGDWTANAVSGTPGGIPGVSGGVLTITADLGSEANTFFFDNPMYIGAFKATFTYQDVTNGQTAADGIGFILQNDPRGLSALAGGGNLVGYAGGAGSGIMPSAAIVTELFPQVGSVGYQYVTNGNTASSYNSPSPINLGSGDPINWTVLYNGSSITLTMTDEVTSRTFSTNFAVGSLPEIVGGETAYIGFGGGTGGFEALQTISNFTYVPFPVLSAANSNGNAIITWPTGIGGYALQESSSLSSTNWTPVPGPYTIVGTQYQQIVTSPTGNEFFRLVVAP